MDCQRCKEHRDYALYFGCGGNGCDNILCPACFKAYGLCALCEKQLLNPYLGHTLGDEPEIVLPPIDPVAVDAVCTNCMTPVDTTFNLVCCHDRCPNRLCKDCFGSASSGYCWHCELVVSIGFGDTKHEGAP